MKVGRPETPANLKKVPVGMKLPQWLKDWSGSQTKSRAVLVEEALKKVHKLKTPPAG